MVGNRSAENTIAEGSTGEGSSRVTEKVSAVGFFFVGIILLLAHLLSISAGIPFPTPVFWVSVVIIIGSLVFQILRLASSGSFANLILCEILVANFTLHMIYVLPYPGLYGGSPNTDWWVLNHFLESGTFSLSTQPFPGFYIFNGELSLATGMPTFDVARYIPSLLDTFLILVLYLFLRHILQNVKEALFTVLLLVTLFFHVWFYSIYHWEVLGICLVVLALYIYFGTRTHLNSVTRIGLSLICIISLLFSHHLSGLYLIVFFIIYLATSQVLRFIYKGKGSDVSTSFVLIAIVLVVSYWIYVYVAALRNVIEFAESFLLIGQTGEALFQAQVTMPDITVRDYVVKYGFYAFHVIFAAVILYNLIFTKRKQNAWYTSSALILFLWGAIGILTMYVLPRTYAKLDSDRALVLGWLFGFAPLVAGILGTRRSWFRGLGVCTLVCFMFFGVYMISPIQWNPAAEEPNSTATSEDIALAETIDFSDRVGLFSGQTTLMAIYNTHSIYNQYTKWDIDVSFYLVILATRTDYVYGYEEFPELDWVILNRKYVEREKELTSEGLLDYSVEEAQELSVRILELSEAGYDGYQRRDLVYESNNLRLFR